MGNCWSTCFGKLDRRKYLRTRYSADTGFGIEFENLMDEDNPTDNAPRTVTDHERSLLLSGRYDELLYEQKRIDAELDLQLTKHEEEIKAEEEAYYEAQREAAMVAMQQQQREQASKSVTNNGANTSWLGDDDDWDIAGGEDDFEMFLESVKARSLSVKPLQQVTQQGTDRTSCSEHPGEMEWDHEEGMVTPPKIRPEPEGMVTEAELTQAIERKDSDLEWDADDFVSADTAQLVDSGIKCDDEG